MKGYKAHAGQSNIVLEAIEQAVSLILIGITWDVSAFPQNRSFIPH